MIYEYQCMLALIIILNDMSVVQILVPIDFEGLTIIIISHSTHVDKNRHSALVFRL